MKQLLQSGPYLFALAVIGFGLINVVTGNFPPAFMPVIQSSLLRILLVYACGILLISAGICILTNKFARTAATITAILFFADLLYPQLTTSLFDINNASQWTVTLELLALCSGAVILAASLHDLSRTIISPAVLEKCSRIAPYTFAISLLGFALLHYMYADFIATIIPAWMPAHKLLNYVVLVGFVAAAASIIIHIQTRLATALLGIMFLAWVLTLHLPRCFSNPSKADEWSSLFIALAMSGIAFTLSNVPYKKP